ncbi:helix-turn-helix transcriptional regulator [Saccharothrix sp.]|uniref:helix-turn-helix domain-containing protein n=1 Tax=Saccharothrix sp. TaxID=1873460 RepID=UPI0028111C1F|nr:helix-turn-helix transcriptional regulator [Saccharothrix sp.]
MCPTIDTPPRLWTYVESRLTAQGLSTGDLARATGLNRSQFSAWRRGSKITIETARTLAAFFGSPLLEVMVAADLITAQEADLRHAQPDPAGLSDTAILAELGSRLAHLHHRCHGQDSPQPGSPVRSGWLIVPTDNQHALPPS